MGRYNSRAGKGINVALSGVKVPSILDPMTRVTFVILIVKIVSAD